MMKRVRFQDDFLITAVHEVMNTPCISQDEGHVTWYSRGDFKNMKTNCKILSKELHQYGRSHLLTGSTQVFNDTPNLNDVELDKVQLRLILWTKCGESCRGLEKWVNNNEGEKRKELQQRSIKIVLKAQKRYGALQFGVLAEKLKSHSETSTIYAKVFARKMAIADEAAAASFWNYKDIKTNPYAVTLCKWRSNTAKLEIPFSKFYSHRIDLK
jgi:hypothetical protein